jgi:membrane protease YdiL (CAAX protease family)
VLVGGVVWTALHGPRGWSAIAVLMVTSLVYGWLIWRTGGLEVTLAHHAVNNLVGSLLGPCG